LGQVEILQAQVGHFFHAQPTPQHQQEDRPVPKPLEGAEEDFNFLIFEKAGQRPGQAQRQPRFDRIGSREACFPVSVMIESADTVQTAVNRLRG